MRNANDTDILNELKRIRLLNIKEMKKLFVDAEIIKEKYLAMVKSIIAVKK